MASIDESIIAAGVGFATGVLGTFIAPWVSWGVERRRRRYQQRKEMTAQCRRVIATVVTDDEYTGPGELEWCLIQHPEFLALRPHLSSQTLAMFQDENLPAHEVIEAVLEDVAAIERNWHLL